METFAYLQVAETYEGTVSGIDAASPMSQRITPGFSGIAGWLLWGRGASGWVYGMSAVWVALLSPLVQAVEPFDPGFRTGSATDGFIPISSAATRPTAQGTLIPINCSDPRSICAQVCPDDSGNNPGEPTPPVSIRPPVRPPVVVQPPIAILPPHPDDDFVAVRPPRGGIFLRRGDSGPEVQRIQELLRAAGYFDAPSTGFFASLTQSAVTAFQQDNGLAVDGIVGEETLAALEGRVYRPVNPPRPVPLPTPIDRVGLEFGDRGPRVADLQLALRQIGFFTGSITGVFDAETEQAVIAFQQSSGLVVNGTADIATLTALGLPTYRA